MSRDLRVALDHGQLYLYTAAPDPDLTVELMEAALGVGIAQRGPGAVLTSPHQLGDTGRQVANATVSQ